MGLSVRKVTTNVERSLLSSSFVDFVVIVIVIVTVDVDVVAAAVVVCLFVVLLDLHTRLYCIYCTPIRCMYV